MGRYFVALIVMAAVLPRLTGGPHAVSARVDGTGTASPTPAASATPTPTPPGPTADDLLAAATQAFTTHGSVRTTSLLTGRVAGVEEVSSRQVSDVSFHHQDPRFHTTTRVVTTELLSTPHKKQVVRTTTIIVADRAASRRVRSRTWACVSLFQLSQSDSTLLTQIAAIVSSGRVVYGTPQETALHGEAVWDIPATVARLGAGDTVRADLYVRQSDHTLVLQTLSASITMNGKAAVEHLMETYSRYGEHVRIRLPAVCAQTQADGRRQVLQPGPLGLTVPGA